MSVARDSRRLRWSRLSRVLSTGSPRTPFNRIRAKHLSSSAGILRRQGHQQEPILQDGETNANPAISRKSVLIPLGSGKILLDPIFLRDACSCPRCVDPSTRQRLFETADIPLTIAVNRLRTLPDGTAILEWTDDVPGFDDHTTMLPFEFLANQRHLHERLKISHSLSKHIHWDREKMVENNYIIEYEDYLGSDRTLHCALKQLDSFGMVYLSNVSNDPKAIELIANRIGPLRNSLYGSTWDVRSVASAKNVAYTSQHLAFHMDLLYMADPPGLQILHCMKSSTQGGESLFADAFRAMNLLEERHQDLARNFATYSVTYRYKNDGSWYQQTRNTVERGLTSHPPHKISTKNAEYATRTYAAVNWSPPFQAPFEQDIGSARCGDSNESRLRSYVKGAKVFKELIEADDAIFETKMHRGTCVIFNNRRVLHARRSFSSEHGERWLRGAYVDTDAFRSRIRILNNEFGAEDVI
ncbi:MAG: hypothetical protein Q9187_000432 [Circinaria calcarea]